MRLVRGRGVVVVVVGGAGGRARVAVIVQGTTGATAPGRRVDLQAAVAAGAGTPPRVVSSAGK